MDARLGDVALPENDSDIGPASSQARSSFGWMGKINVFSRRRRRRQQSLELQGHPSGADGAEPDILGLETPKKRSLFLRHHKGATQNRPSVLDRDRSGTTRLSAETETTTTTETTSKVRIDMGSMGSDGRQPRRSSNSILQDPIFQQSNHLHDESQQQATINQPQQQPQHLLAPVEEIESNQNSRASSSNASLSKEIESTNQNFGASSSNASVSTKSIPRNPNDAAEAPAAAATDAGEAGNMSSAATVNSAEGATEVDVGAASTTSVSTAVSPLSTPSQLQGVPISPECDVETPAVLPEAASESGSSSSKGSQNLDNVNTRIIERIQMEEEGDDEFTSMIQLLQSTTRSTTQSVKLIVSTMEELFLCWTTIIDLSPDGDRVSHDSSNSLGNIETIRKSDPTTVILLLVTTILSTMKRHAHVGRIQNAGCKLLASIVTHHEDGSDASAIIMTVMNSRQLARNIVDGLILALERHGPRYAGIIVHSCHIITPLVGWLVSERTSCQRFVMAIVASIQPSLQSSMRVDATNNSNSNSTCSSSSNNNSPSQNDDNRPHPKRENETQEPSKTNIQPYQIHQDALGTLRFLVVGCSSNVSTAIYNRPKVLETLVKVMKRYSSHVTIQEHACETIWNLFPHRHPTSKASTKANLEGKKGDSNEWKSGCRPSIIITEAITAIISVMRKYPHIGSLQELSCCALASLADVFFQNFNDGASSNKMKDIIPHKNTTLSTDAMGSSPLTWLLLETMMKRITQAMQSHPSSLSLQTAACGAIWHWTKPSQHAEQQRDYAVNTICHMILSTPDMITCIVVTTRMHMLSSSVQKRATGILHHLVKSHRLPTYSREDAGAAAVKKRVSDLTAPTLDVQTSTLLQVLLSPSAMGTLFEILQHHEQDEVVHENDCNVLAVLLEYVHRKNNEGKSHSVSRFLLSLFTVERTMRYLKTTVSVLQRYSRHSSIAASSCRMLSYLLAIHSKLKWDMDGDDDGSNKKHDVNQLTWNIPALVVSCMKNNLRNARLQEAACATLRHFADSDEVFFHESIASIGGLDVLFLAMKHNLIHPTVQAMAAATLKRLIIRLDSLDVVSVEDGISILVLAMEMHESITIVQEASLLALRFWTWHSIYQERIVAANGRERILSAMERHLGVSLIQQVGCDILATLSRFEYADPKIPSSISSTCSATSSVSALSSTMCSVDRVIQAFIASVDHHSDHPEVQVTALEALLQVSNAQDRGDLVEKAVGDKIRSMGGIDVILSILKQDLAGATLHRLALTALCRLVQWAGTCKQFERSDIDAILKTMQSQHSNVAVQESSCNLLKRLSLDNANLAILIAMTGGALDTIFDSLEEHVDSLISATEASSLLAVLLDIHGNNEAGFPIGDTSKVVRAVVSAMARYSDNDLIQRNSYIVLCRLAIHHSDIGSTVVWPRDCAQSIISKMGGLQKSPYYQELGCRAIFCLVSNHETELVPLIASLGGVDLVLRAMQNYNEHSSLHSYACGALGKLAIALDSMAIPDMGILTIITSMTTHQDIYSLQEGGLYAIRFLSWSQENQELIVFHKGIEAIISALRQFPESSTIQKLACGALDNLATNEESKALIGSSGAVKLILSGMQLHTTESSLHEYGCSVLGNLASNESCKVVISEAGGIDVIMATMKIFSKELSVQKEACNALYRLTYGSSCSVSSTWIGQIVSTMKLHISSNAVQAHCCGVLRNFCMNVENREATALAGGVDVLLGCMREHQDDTVVQEQAFGALFKLSLDDDNQATIISQGGLGTLLAEMRLHHEIASLQEIGLDVIANLAAADGVHLSTSSEEVIEAITLGMRNHLKSPVIQERGCDALVIVALASGENPRTIEAVLDSIVAAMKAHSENSSVCESCFQALRLYAVSEASQIHISSSGVIDRIVSIMESHPTIVPLQKEGCGILGDLASNYERKVAIAANGLRVILSALEGNKKDADVQEAGCCALCSLSEESTNQALIASAGGIDTTLRSMRAHYGNLLIQVHCCGTLSNLAMNDTNKLSIAAAHGINSILAAMRFHSDSLSLQKHACQALSNIAANTTSRLIIVSSGGIGTILATMNKFSREAAIQKRCSEALNHLAWNSDNRETIAGRVDIILKGETQHCSWTS